MAYDTDLAAHPTYALLTALAGGEEAIARRNARDAQRRSDDAKWGRRAIAASRGRMVGRGEIAVMGPELERALAQLGGAA